MCGAITNAATSRHIRRWQRSRGVPRGCCRRCPLPRSILPAVVALLPRIVADTAQCKPSAKKFMFRGLLPGTLIALPALRSSVSRRMALHLRLQLVDASCGRKQALTRIRQLLVALGRLFLCRNALLGRYPQLLPKLVNFALQLGVRLAHVRKGGQRVRMVRLAIAHLLQSMPCRVQLLLGPPQVHLQGHVVLRQNVDSSLQLRVKRTVP
mmetsp:Transcript_143601/g.459357  ORF Transcript_143601/g.459357 Transcript_143601/m.459357 type:complete len:210 (+) Transcript_143601:1337-1966(+)